MKCAACKSTGIVKHESRMYCNKCYCRLIEKRVKRYARANKLFSKDDKLCIKDPNLEHIVKQVVQGMPIKITKRCVKGSKKVIFWTLDDENARFIDKFVSPKFKIEKD